MRHGQELSDDELITLHEEECLGVCDFAPVAQVNFANHDSVTPERMRELIGALRDGSVPQPSRGAPPMDSFRTASRVLAGLEETPA
jgi:NADH-quinone oxidoreductase subunit E